MTAAIVVVLVIAALLVFIATRPAGFRVERKATIAAPPDKVFGLLSDFHQWGSWSPWEKLDPAMHKTYDGAPSGVGASYLWKGNNKAGEGRMTIVECQPPQKLGIQLEFLRPFAATNQTQFTLATAAGGTAVDWVMTGNRNFMLKAFGLFMDMDKLVGKDFEAGLANLDQASQAAAKDAPVGEAKPETAPDETASEAESADSNPPESP